MIKRKKRKELTPEDVAKAAEGGQRSFEEWMKAGKLPVKK